MKTYILNMSSGISQGLRPVDKAFKGKQSNALIDALKMKDSKNDPRLIAANNLKPCFGGVERISAPALVTYAGATWPYPQLIPGYKGVFACKIDTIGSVNADKSVTPLLGSLTVGQRWSCADFMKYQVFTNGSVTVVRNVGTDALELYEGSSIPQADCIINFRGQCIAAGLPNSWYGGDVNWAAWGGIGDISFLMSRKNTQGVAPMSWKGQTYMLLVLGKGIVVYGAGGISKLIPTGTGGYGVLLVRSSGIPGFGAACGDEGVHFFLDTSYDLWKMTDSGPEWLGYKEFLSPLGTSVVMSYDPRTGDVYISNATNTYIYSEIYKSLTGPVSMGVNVCHGVIGTLSETLYASPAAITIGESLIVTDVFNMQYPGIKTICTVSLEGDIPADTTIALDYRYDKRSSFTRTSYVGVGNEGIATVRVGGVEYRMVVKSSTAALNVQGISLGWQASDKRFVRGSYAV